MKLSFITKKLIGILGGTFNPVHSAHINIALTTIEYMQLEQVQLIPCVIPPHKTTKNLLPFQLRVDLLQAAVQKYPSLSINILESILPQPLYTWDMISYWKQLHSTYQPLFILSNEDFAMLDTWHNGLNLPSITNFLIMPRTTNKKESFSSTLKRLWNCTTIIQDNHNKILSYASLFKNHYCFFLNIPIMDISSSDIRKKWRRGIYLTHTMPTSVVEVLKNQNNLLKKLWE